MTGNGRPGVQERAARDRRVVRLVVGALAVVWPVPWFAVGGLLTLAPGTGRTAAALFVVGALGPLAAVLWSVALRPRTLAAAVTAQPAAVARGEGVRVKAEGAAGLEGLEVGLVCVETYQQRQRRGTSAGADRTTRVSARATAWEDWRPGAEAAFAVPPDAPYSYAGDAIAYSWEARARTPRGLRAAATVFAPVEVAP